MSRLSSTLSLLFGLHQRVPQLPYAVVGLTLAGFKYLVEFFLILAATDHFYTPLEFISPLFSYHAASFSDHTELAWFIFVWTIPFVWIALNMSVRRAVDAEGISPWIGLLVLIPLINLGVIGLLCFAPSDPRYQSTDPEPMDEMEEKGIRTELLVIFSISVGLGIGALMIVLSVLAMESYGTGLFIGTPVVMGATSSYIFNSQKRRSYYASLGIGAATIALGAMCLLLFALEGAVCIVMAIPLMFPLGLFGSLIGITIAEATTDENQAPYISALVITLPLVAGLETYFNAPRETVVMTAVEINAPPERVWDSVISFPEIDSPQPWYFRLGLASPLRAHIDGQGVGAVRHCEFTTGEFVEPITTWDRPRQLAFDVTEQPDPLVELSPFRDIHPPHLDGYMRSNHGEFRLIQLADGRTRLEGRTWYEIRMFPQSYWMLWSDLIVHRIHLRVLEHIREQAEAKDT
ncbi:hypothetical protein GC197_07200 [bacterium]|nr:hypothetical protein [bacterium]